MELMQGVRKGLERTVHINSRKLIIGGKDTIVGFSTTLYLPNVLICFFGLLRSARRLVITTAIAHWHLGEPIGNYNEEEYDDFIAW